MGHSVSGSDVLFVFTAPTTRAYNFVGTDSFDSIIYVLTTLPALCGGPATVSPSAFSDDPPIINNYAMTAGQTVYVVMDAYSTGSGVVSLTVQ